jgi:WhiB family redox-sensing transcriptional regulator
MTAPTAPEFDGTQLCAETDPELFFPGKGGTPREAKAICERCEFLEPCLAYALRATDPHGYPLVGVWGGTTAQDRRRLRQRNRRTAA